MTGEFWVGPFDNPDRIRLGPAEAAGAEGVLYRGYIELDSAPVTIAVKMLQPGHLGQLSEWIARWNEHMQLLKRVKIAGLVGVRGGFVGSLPHHKGQADSSTSSLYLLMDWVEGVALHRWAASVEAVAPEQLLLALVPVAGALDLLHSGAATGGVAVVHRDVKPANILVRPAGDTVLVDVGAIRGLADDTRRSGVVGTPGYIAPEARADGDYTPAADRYSFGAVAFSLLTGDDPPVDASLDDLQDKLRAAPLLEGRGELVDHVVAMLDPDPAKRPTGLANWVAQLRRSSLVALPGDIALAPRAPGRNPAAGDRPTRRGGRSRRRVPLAIAAALVVAMATTVALAGGGVFGAKGNDTPTVAAATVTTSTTVAVPSTTTTLAVVPEPSGRPDFANMTYPFGTCGTNTPEFTLKDGKNVLPSGRTEAAPTIEEPEIALTKSQFAQLDGAGPPEAVTLLRCAHGMTDHSSTVVVWKSVSDRYAPIHVFDEAPRTDDWGYPVDFKVRGEVIEVVDLISAGDANCCRSTYLRSRYTLEGSQVSGVGPGPDKILALSVPGDPLTIPEGGYPHISFLEGFIRGRDVFAIATPSAIKSLENLGVFSVDSYARSCEAAPPVVRCLVPYTAEGGVTGTLELTIATVTHDVRHTEDVYGTVTGTRRIVSEVKVR